MGRLEQRKRNRNQKQRNSIVAIGCEGKNKTETKYLKNFSSRSCNIKFSTGSHTDPVGMANDLVKFMKNEDIKPSYGDKIYLLIDTDINKNEQNKIEEAKKICKKNGIELITSTPTFEYWYLLHYGYKARKYKNSQTVKDMTEKAIPGYTESMDVYPIIKDKTEEAIKNAKRIEKEHIKNGYEIDSDEANPHTSIYKVVEELMRRNFS